MEKSTAKARRHKRIRKKVSGTEKCPRLSVYRSINNNYAQLVDDEKKVTLISCSDLKMKKSGTKTEMAHKVGLELAKKASEKKITECVFDRSGYKYHGRIKAIAEGAREGGIKF